MKKMLITYSIIIFCATFFQIGKVKQGISGKVYIKHGNSMPMQGQAINSGQVASCEVFIYELTNIEQVTSTDNTYFSNIKTKLVKKSRSSNDGFYTIELPPGQYSVFVNDNGHLYANNLDGKGNINAITVKKDSVSNRDIIISSRATF